MLTKLAVNRGSIQKQLSPSNWSKRDLNHDATKYCEIFQTCSSLAAAHWLHHDKTTVAKTDDEYHSMIISKLQFLRLTFRLCLWFVAHLAPSLASISMLPAEILQLVFRELQSSTSRDHNDFTTAFRVCSKWREIGERLLWTDISLADECLSRFVARNSGRHASKLSLTIIIDPVSCEYPKSQVFPGSNVDIALRARRLLSCGKHCERCLRSCEGCQIL